MDKNHDEFACEHIQLLLAALTSDEQPPLPEASAEHIAACPTCRQHLLALFVNLDLAPPTAGSCDPERLAAFIDAERADPAAALRTYPDVWAHLWICADCLDTYEFVRELAADPELPELTLPAHLTAAAIPAPSANTQINQAFQELFTLRPQILINTMYVLPGAQHAKNAAQRRQTMRGAAKKPVTILRPVPANDARPGYAAAARLHDDGTQDLIVTLTPPTPGSLRLTLANTALTAPIGDDGRATFYLSHELIDETEAAPIRIELLPANA